MYKIVHCNINVVDLQRSIAFYKDALDFHIVRQKKAEDGSFILCYLGNDRSPFELELTWLKEHPLPYELGENESHIAFTTSDYDVSYKKHKEQDCICFENKDMGIYFIEDPDGYWLEILPAT